MNALKPNKHTQHHYNFNSYAIYEIQDSKN